MKKKMFIIALAFSLIVITFMYGIYVGANRAFPYNYLRKASEKVRSSSFNLSSGSKKGVVIFGDSLSARGEWGALRNTDEYEVLLLARGGVTAKEFIYDPKDHDGDIHVYWLGTNDLLRNIDLTGAYDSVTSMAKDSALSGKSVIILGIPVPIGVSKMLNSAILHYNQQINTACIEHGWYYLDTEDRLNHHFPDRSKITKDGVHLNLESSNMIAEYLKQVCDSID